MTMDQTIDMKDVFEPTEDIVAREIEGEIIIIPLIAGIGDAEDNLYTLNSTGREIWQLLDGKRTVREVVDELSRRYPGSAAEIERDVNGLLQEFHERGFVVKQSA